MNQIDTDLPAYWAATVPLIQARQQEIAERNAAATPVAAEEGSRRRGVEGAESARPVTAPDRNEATAKTAEEGTKPREEAARGPSDLSDAEQDQVDKLRARDREVRDHEQAHARVGGAYASAPSYTYQAGPDGRRYAIGGEVQIDVSPVADDPEATILKMQVVKAAALAPAEPSSADRSVAAYADAMRAQAVADLAKQSAEERAAAFDARM